MFIKLLDLVLGLVSALALTILAQEHFKDI